MITCEDLIEKIKSTPARSAWRRGVRVTAEALIQEAKDEAPGAVEVCKSGRDLERLLLNGAESWQQYSYYGMGLVYDFQIARLYCTPSELKRTFGGDRRPNKKETWLDVQARALSQACRLACSCFEIMKGAN